MVGVTAGQQLRCDLAIPVQALHLVERTLVVIETQPVHSVQDRLGGGLRGSLDIGVFDAQNELAAGFARIGP